MLGDSQSSCEGVAANGIVSIQTSWWESLKSYMEPGSPRDQFSDDVAGTLLFSVLELVASSR